MSLDGLHPDSFYAARAMRFTQALHDQHAYHEAMAGIQSEASGYQRLRGEMPAVA